MQLDFRGLLFAKTAGRVGTNLKGTTKMSVSQRESDCGTVRY